MDADRRTTLHARASAALHELDSRGRSYRDDPRWQSARQEAVDTLDLLVALEAAESEACALHANIFRLLLCFTTAGGLKRRWWEQRQFALREARGLMERLEKGGGE